MFKKLLPATLIALSIMLVTAGTAALAIGIADRGSREDLIDRVAADLGLESEEVEEALSQAKREQFKERQDEALANLVESGVITQEQSDSASAWLDSRPESADRLLASGRFAPLAMTHGAPLLLNESRAFSGLSLGSDDLLDRLAEILGVDPQTLKDSVKAAEEAQAVEQREEAMSDFIDALVEDGELTESEGDEIKSWLADMPGWLLEIDGLSFLMNGGIGALISPNIFQFDFDGTLPDFEFNGPEPGFLTPEREGELRFFFGDPGRQFEFNGENRELPEELRRMLDELHEGFQFENGSLDGFPWAPFEMPDADEMTEETDQAGQSA